MAELGDRRVVESVEFIGAIDSKSRNAVSNLQRQEFEGHGKVFVGKLLGIRRAAATARRSNLRRSFATGRIG
ncbi:MAG TPA: hypothetical protein VNG73_03810 [Gemmatimonadaceae bacterium]|nr:hypothetical protein [Gemmatimonadaceae bacterium]